MIVRFSLPRSSLLPPGGAAGPQEGLARRRPEQVSERGWKVIPLDEFAKQGGPLPGRTPRPGALRIVNAIGLRALAADAIADATMSV